MRRANQIILIIAALGITISNASASPRFFPATGSWYDAVVIQNTWTEARAAAEGMSYLGIPGRLATITSQAENDFLVQSVLPIQWYGLWIGGIQTSGPEPLGVWEWITGEPWSFSNWDIAEPNNAIGYEDFLQMYSDWPELLTGRRLVGTWNDVSDSAEGYKSSGYVIEYAAIPEPSTFALAGLGAAGLMIARRRR